MGSSTLSLISPPHLKNTVLVGSHHICTMTMLMIALLLAWQIDFYGFLRPRWNKRSIVVNCIILWSLGLVYSRPFYITDVRAEEEINSLFLKWSHIHIHSTQCWSRSSLNNNLVVCLPEDINIYNNIHKWENSSKCSKTNWLFVVLQVNTLEQDLY